jgi:peptidoglycan/xylan/chitin deacetylase (PgdA/CDA1 family)
MEQDCPPYFSTFRGVEGGTPKLLDLFEEEEIPATFFTTGDVARRYPQVIQNILQKKHELGCHGDTHRRFDQMDAREAEKEIQDSSKTLREFGSVTSFRAPNLVFPNDYLKLLEEAGYRLDSSQAKYKRAYRKNNHFPTSLSRIPASVTSSVLRLPKAIRFPWLKGLSDPAILFVHPWEFIDLRKEKLRLDCRFRTGDFALSCLQENIRMFKQRGAKFLRMRDLPSPPLE